MALKFSAGVQIVGINLWNTRLILGTLLMSKIDNFECQVRILIKLRCRNGLLSSRFKFDHQ